jgi:hypothetical protein
MCIVTLARLNWALRQVVEELERHGLWDEQLDRINVYLVPWSWACYGWQHYGSTGDICIPSISVARLADRIRGHELPLTDILRHEYGHALAYISRRLFRSSWFRQAFGASHEKERASFVYDPRFHVSPYAAINASEDFAETFVLFLRHRGRLPAAHRTPAKQAKWTFIRNVCSALRRGQKSWAA